MHFGMLPFENRPEFYSGAMMAKVVTVDKLRNGRSLDSLLRDLGYKIDARGPGEPIWQLYQINSNIKIGKPEVQSEIIKRIERN